MRDTELSRCLLGLLEPWTVDRVELNVTERRVDVWGHSADRRGVAVPGVCVHGAGSRPCGGAHLAALGQLPLSDVSARPHSPRGVSCASRASVAGPLGRTGLALYSPV